MDNIIHVVPINDVIEHVDTDECICGPTSELVQVENKPDGWLIVHHPLDGRENHEPN